MTGGAAGGAYVCAACRPSLRPMSLVRRVALLYCDASVRPTASPKGVGYTSNGLTTFSLFERPAKDGEKKPRSGTQKKRQLVQRQ